MSELVNLNPNLALDHPALGSRTIGPREIERVSKAVQLLNQQNQSEAGPPLGTQYNFSYDPGSQRETVSVVDRTNGQVLYQMPAREVLRLAAEARRKQAEGLE